MRSEIRKSFFSHHFFTSKNCVNIPTVIFWNKAGNLNMTDLMKSGYLFSVRYCQNLNFDMPEIIPVFTVYERPLSPAPNLAPLRSAIGMMESWVLEHWNGGFRESKRILLYWFSRNIGVFSGAKAENGCLMGIIIKCRYNIFL